MLLPTNVEYCYQQTTNVVTQQMLLPNKCCYQQMLLPKSVTIPVVGPGLVSTSPARRRRRRIPMMLLLDHTFIRRFACTQRGFLLYETALLLTQVCFIAGCRWQRILTSILDCVSQWHNKVYLATFFFFFFFWKCRLLKLLLTTVSDSMLLAD